MKTVVLVNPPVTLEERYGAFAQAGTIHPPIGLISLAAILREAGYRSIIIDSEARRMSLEDVVNEICALQPSYVGFTAVSMSVYRAAETAARIKKLTPDTTTLIGGPHFFALPHETMRKFKQFDYGIVGEGEIATPLLLEKLDEGRKPETVPGVIYRDNGSLTQNGTAPQTKDLDTLPMAAWDLLEGFPQIYSSSVHKLGRWPSTSLVTSRGCFGKCTFCDNSMYGNNIRVRRAGSIINEIRYLHERFGINDVFFTDDNFLVNKKRIVEFCELLSESGMHISWGCYSRVDSVKDIQMLKLMRRSGCWRVTYGLESGSQEILDFYRKGITIEQMKLAVRMTKNAKIKCKGFFMIGNFLETPETLRETSQFILKSGINDFHITFLTPLPGTPLYDRAQDYGTYDNDWPRMNLWNPLFIPHGISREELLRFRKNIYMKFYADPVRIIKGILSLRSWVDIKKIFRGYSTLLRFLFGSADQNCSIVRKNVSTDSRR